MKRYLKLPYPDKSLNPNRKTGRHWAVTKKAKDAAFEIAYYEAKQAFAGVTVPEKPMAIAITYVRKDKRLVDLDNLLSSSKSHCDAIAKGIGVDDKYFEPITIKRGYDTESYMLVEIDIMENENE